VPFFGRRKVDERFITGERKSNLSLSSERLRNDMKERKGKEDPTLPGTMRSPKQVAVPLENLKRFAILLG